MSHYLVNYDGVDYNSPNWFSALRGARNIVDRVSKDPDCVSIISVLRHNSEQECIKSGSVSVYRVLTKTGVEPVLVIYVS